MLHTNASRTVLAFLTLTLLLAGSCGQDNQENKIRKHFSAGANRERGIEVLNPSKAELPFYHSFGKLPYGKVFSHTFELRNVEDRAITIKRTEPACSCSRVKSIHALKGANLEDGVVVGDLSQKDNILRVEPGQAFSVEILVDTKRVPPNAQKLVVVRMCTDSPIEPYLTFELNFLPEKHFELASPSLRLGDIPLGGGVGNTLQIYSRVAINDARLIDVFSTTEGLEAELVLIPGFQANWNLSVTAVGQEVRGPLRGNVILRTTDGHGQGDAGRLEIPVEGRVVPAVMMYPSNLSFGRIAIGKGSSLHAGVQGLAPGHKIEILAAHLSGASAEHLSVELERIATDSFGKSARIDVHVHCAETAPPGAIDAKLTLDLVDELNPTIIRSIHGLVE